MDLGRKIISLSIRFFLFKLALFLGWDDGFWQQGVHNNGPTLGNLLNPS